MTELWHVVTAPVPELQPMPGGLLVTNAAVVPLTVMSTVDGPAVPVPVQAGLVGEAPVFRHGSVPVKFTVALGSPPGAVKVQLELPGAFGMFRLAEMLAVVWP